MQNKPVAYRHWMIDEEFPEDSCWEYFDAPTGEDCKECIPLYTHPHSEESVKVKELTDEEIAQVHKETFSKLATDLDFAKAILRKAQEK